MSDNPRSRKWGGSQCRRPAYHSACISFLVLFSAITGCNSPAKKPVLILEKYFPQKYPESCLVGFVFALENRNWDAAYSRLSNSTKEKVGQFKFKYGLPLLKDPKTGIPVLDIITESVSDRTHLPRVPGQAPEMERIRLNYIGKDTKGRVAAYVVTVYLIDEREPEAKEALWRLDLVRTAEELSKSKG